MQSWLATGPLSGVARPLYHRIELIRWRRAEEGAGPAPHLLKERVVRRYARDYGLRVLVETGTYLGDMIAAVRKDFAEIHSIELNEELCRRARQRFAGDAGVHLYCGDSGAILPVVLATLSGSALFWLDAHFSGGITARGEEETPVLRELELLLESGGRRQVVLIDDARRFTGESGYPTLEQVRDRIRSRAYSFSVRDDVIRIVPAG